MVGDGTSFSTAGAAPGVEVDPILAAAAELFDRLGYEKVRVEDVAKRSHVSKNTLYKRYHHKPGLLAGLVATFAREFALHLAAFAERRHDPDVERRCADVGGGGGQVGSRSSPAAVRVPGFLHPQWGADARGAGGPRSALGAM